jgi:hypothetical protein
MIRKFSLSLATLNILAALLLSVNLYGVQNEPKPPEGAFPEKVNGLKLAGDIISSNQNGYIKHDAEYKVDGNVDSDSTIEYLLKIYPSAKEAEEAWNKDWRDYEDEALEAEKKKNMPATVLPKIVTIKSGQKIQTFIRTSVLTNYNTKTISGMCIMEYARGSNVVKLTGMFSCDSVERFLIDLYSQTR